MTKIGIDIRNLGKKRTGDETVFFNLVKNLALIISSEQIKGMKFLLFTDIADKQKIEKIKADLNIENKKNFEIVVLRSSNKFIWNLWTLPHYLRKNPVDIYHTQYITPFFVSRKTKIITHIHDISFRVFSKLIKKTDWFFLKILIPISLRRADKIIAVSEFTKNEIVKYYIVAPEKIAVIPNAISEDFFLPVSAKKLLAVRSRYNLPDKFILYMGTLQPRKNIPFLVRAFSLAANKLSDYKLVLVGSQTGHNFDKKIDQVIAENKMKEKVIFTGYIDEKDKVAFFQSARIFVFPSLYEGFGIPLLEAMSKGVPVIASDIASLREVGGQAVIYFSPDNVEELAKKILSVATDKDLRAKMALAGQERIRFFSWRRSAEKLLAVYEKTEKANH